MYNTNKEKGAVNLGVVVETCDGAKGQVPGKG